MIQCPQVLAREIRVASYSCKDGFDETIGAICLGRSGLGEMAGESGWGETVVER